MGHCDHLSVSIVEGEPPYVHNLSAIQHHIQAELFLCVNNRDCDYYNVKSYTTRNMN